MDVNMNRSRDADDEAVVSLRAADGYEVVVSIRLITHRHGVALGVAEGTHDHLRSPPHVDDPADKPPSAELKDDLQLSNHKSHISPSSPHSEVPKSATEAARFDAQQDVQQKPAQFPLATKDMDGGSDTASISSCSEDFDFGNEQEADIDDDLVTLTDDVPNAIHGDTMEEHQKNVFNNIAEAISVDNPQPETAAPADVQNLDTNVEADRNDTEPAHSLAWDQWNDPKILIVKVISSLTGESHLVIEPDEELYILKWKFLEAARLDGEVPEAFDFSLGEHVIRDDETAKQLDMGMNANIRVERKYEPWGEAEQEPYGEVLEKAWTEEERKLLRPRNPWFETGERPWDEKKQESGSSTNVLESSEQHEVAWPTLQPLPAASAPKAPIGEETDKQVNHQHDPSLQPVSEMLASAPTQIIDESVKTEQSATSPVLLDLDSPEQDPAYNRHVDYDMSDCNESVAQLQKDDD